MTDRKARLAALAAKAGRLKPAAEETTDAAADAGQTETKPALKFRNYTPVDAVEPSTKRSKAEPEKKKSALESALEKVQSEAPAAPTDMVVEMAPKKINWDLKRDIQPKLDKLERRTQKAIIELLKERLAREAEAGEVD